MTTQEIVEQVIRTELDRLDDQERVYVAYERDGLTVVDGRIDLKVLAAAIVKALER